LHWFIAIPFDIHESEGPILQSLTDYKLQNFNRVESGLPWIYTKANI
jgi:hypothetical protein